jgi:hypothetical protein
MAFGTNTFTRQYDIAVGPAPAVAVSTDSMVTGGPSANSRAEPIPAASQLVTGDCATAALAQAHRQQILSRFGKLATRRGTLPDGFVFTACSPVVRDQQRMTVGVKRVIFNRLD